MEPTTKPEEGASSTQFAQKAKAAFALADEFQLEGNPGLAESFQAKGDAYLNKACGYKTLIATA